MDIMDMNINFLISLFVGFWIGGFGLTLVEESYLRIIIPGWLSRLLFIRKCKGKIPIVAVIWQIWLYVMSAFIIIAYKTQFISDINELGVITYNLFIGTIIIWGGLVLLDMGLFLVTNRKQ